MSYRHTCGAEVDGTSAAYAHLLVCPVENRPAHLGDCVFCRNRGTTDGCPICGRWSLFGLAALRRLS